MTPTLLADLITHLTTSRNGQPAMDIHRAKLITRIISCTTWHDWHHYIHQTPTFYNTQPEPCWRIPLQNMILSNNCNRLQDRNIA